MIRFLSFLFLCVLSQTVLAQTFTSTQQQVPLIELFTSEGCSSCPPADRFLSKFKNHEKLWQTFVPLSFHVDYWDYIGWPDPFASKEYSQRQRRYAAENGESTVYTPGLRKAGEEWRSWRLSGDPALSDASVVGELMISLDESGEFNAKFASQNDESLQLNVALLGMGLTSEVSRGENKGKTLSHEFVVLGISTYASATKGVWSGQLPDASVAAPNYAIAAWVSKGGSLAPLQATGGVIDLADN